MKRWCFDVPRWKGGSCAPRISVLALIHLLLHCLTIDKDGNVEEAHLNKNGAFHARFEVALTKNSPK
jgi:hypothetical protein